MNVLDSQRLAGILESQGFARVDSAEQADVALLNTCSVREKAVQKVISRLGELRHSRQERGLPQVIGLCGCVAEQEGEAFLSRRSSPDFVLGTGRMNQLARLITLAVEGKRTAAIGFTPQRDYDAHLIARPSSVRQFVTIIHGCNQHCTFCVVPYTRGHEASRPQSEILNEINNLVTSGTLEITLLGQTINAYRCPESGADFSDLLSAVCGVKGLWRLQFVTSHPNYFDDRLIECLGRLPKLGRYFHIPFQAGSDAVLKRMKRGYSNLEYRLLLAKLRAALPDATFSTDVIVGFPGETEEDFQMTMQLIEDMNFGQLYGFVFSPRPKTPAGKYQGQVTSEVAGKRLERLFELQNHIQLQLNRHLVGSNAEVIVDGPARRGDECWQGRGPDNRVINFPGWKDIHEGQLVKVRLVGATAHALVGERIGLLPQALLDTGSD